MSQDLRLYSLSILIMLMLWTAPVHADYGAGAGCPTLAIPIQLNDDDVWHYEDGDNWADYRDLYPYNTTASVSGAGTDDWYDCTLTANSGSYYDGANHLWVLDDNLTCDFLGSGDEGDFRAGGDY